eukprot:TRINITY_DN1336_c0_g1_i1.p1 TRINITY_DN1336_c0_g1~~TRINITY_DN1336_c0_g1_i1.p1  ORF type:complete len:289 (+),score=30.46 TRINITY_DN1336_c0_g1_i1:465-1331(+)
MMCRAGGMLGALMTCPLEVVKTRLQARGNKSSLEQRFRFGLGTYNALRTLLREEGFKGLYRGLGPNLVGVIPSRAIYFFSYGTTKEWLSTSFSHLPGTTVSFLAGVVAGVAVVTTTQPIWLVKTRMQLQSSKESNRMYSNSFDAVRKIYKTEGLRAFYRGMSASYLGITESVLQFVLYDKLKQIMQHQSGNDSLPPSIYLGTASVAKLIAAAATYPHEVIRTRLREAGNVKYRGLFSGLVLIAKEEGVRGLYGGMGAHLMRVVPNAAIMFLTYEMVVEALSTSRPHSR